MKDVFCVIMAGGIGSRFWPLSRQHFPKQYLDIMGTGSSLIQLTYDRLKHLAAPENFMVVTSDEYVQLTLDHLSELTSTQVLAEPARKNTAPCIAYAAYKLYNQNPEAVMVISPADHVILKERAFEETMHTAIAHARDSGNLVTVGIKPTRPDSGYGYIQFLRDFDYENSAVRKIKTFTEKPSVELAIQFLKSGDFYWNSGMFIWSVKSIIAAFEAHMPDLAKLFEEQKHRLNTAEENEAINEIYSLCPNISIDYGVMEKAQNKDVILADLGWSDLGTYGSLYDQISKDDQRNVKLSKNIRLYDTSNSIIRLNENKLAVIQGLNNHIVVDTDDVLLICQKDEEQKIKQFVQDLKQEKLGKFL